MTEKKCDKKKNRINMERATNKRTWLASHDGDTALQRITNRGKNVGCSTW